jgi:hypothetical protein
MKEELINLMTKQRESIDSQDYTSQINTDI